MLSRILKMLCRLSLRNADAICLAMDHTLATLLQADIADGGRVSAAGWRGSVRERGLGRPWASTIRAVLIGELRQAVSASCIVAVGDVRSLGRFVISTKAMGTAAFGGSAGRTISIGSRLWWAVVSLSDSMIYFVFLVEPASFQSILVMGQGWSLTIPAVVLITWPPGPGPWVTISARSRSRWSPRPASIPIRSSVHGGPTSLIMEVILWDIISSLSSSMFIVADTRSRELWIPPELLFFPPSFSSPNEEFLFLALQLLLPSPEFFSLAVQMMVQIPMIRDF